MLGRVVNYATERVSITQQVVAAEVEDGTPQDEQFTIVLHFSGDSLRRLLEGDREIGRFSAFGSEIGRLVCGARFVCNIRQNGFGCDWCSQ